MEQLSLSSVQPIQNYQSCLCNFPVIAVGRNNIYVSSLVVNSVGH
jgi:hypothetical protein